MLYAWMFKEAKCMPLSLAEPRRLPLPLPFSLNRSLKCGQITKDIPVEKLYSHKTNSPPPPAIHLIPSYHLVYIYQRRFGLKIIRSTPRFLRQATWEWNTKKRGAAKISSLRWFCSNIRTVTSFFVILYSLWSPFTFHETQRSQQPAAYIFTEICRQTTMTQKREKMKWRSCHIYIY